MIRKSMPSDLIRGWVPVFPRDKREAFARRSCSNKKLERDDDSKKSHPALAPSQSIRLDAMASRKVRGGRPRILQKSMRLERGIPKCRDPAIAIAVFLDAHKSGETRMERLDRRLFRDRHIIELASCLHRERLIYIRDELPIGVFHEHKCSAGRDLDLHPSFLGAGRDAIGRMAWRMTGAC